MTGIEILAELEQLGVRLRVKDGHIIAQPLSAVDVDLRRKVVMHKTEILMLLKMDDEISWRVRAMLPQIPNEGLIPFLVARSSIKPGPRDCPSCGELLSSTDGYVCGLCSRAKNQAIEIAISRD